MFDDDGLPSGTIEPVELPAVQSQWSGYSEAFELSLRAVGESSTALEIRFGNFGATVYLTTDEMEALRDAVSDELARSGLPAPDEREEHMIVERARSDDGE